MGQADGPAGVGQADGAGVVVTLSRPVRDRLVFLAVAAVSIVAGGLVAAVNGAASFPHGSWLAAYLVLVGGVAQAVLGMGCLALPEPVSSARLRWAQLGLWNVGVAAVAGGVVAGLAAVVLAGSAIVVAALGCFAVGGGPDRPGAHRRVVVYRVVIVGLMVSVAVGAVLSGSVHGS